MTTIPVQTPNGPYVASDEASPISELAWTATSGGTDQFVIPNQRVLVLFRNSGASTRTVSVTSSFDAYGRKADIPATNLAAGAMCGVFLEPHGWENALGSRTIEVASNHAEVLIAVIAV